MILHVVGTMSRLVQTAPKGSKAALTNFGRRGAEKPDDRYLVRKPCLLSRKQTFVVARSALAHCGLLYPRNGRAKPLCIGFTSTGF